MSEEKKIKKDMIIGKVVKNYPETAKIMFNYGLHCIGCHVAASETLEQGCKAHGIEDKDIDEMVKEMNKAIKG